MKFHSSGIRVKILLKYEVVRTISLLLLIIVYETIRTHIYGKRNTTH